MAGVVVTVSDCSIVSVDVTVAISSSKDSFRLFVGMICVAASVSC